MFHNLVYLQYGIEKYSCMGHVLPLLLQRAPKLAELVFYKHTTFSFSHEEKSSPFFYEDVPKCLLSSLTTFHFKGFNGLKINELELTFHFKGFDGLKNELELVRDILMRAKVLKTMSISSYPLTSEDKVRVLEELLVFPRLSSTCQIAFDLFNQSLS